MLLDSGLLEQNETKPITLGGKEQLTTQLRELLSISKDPELGVGSSIIT